MAVVTRMSKEEEQKGEKVKCLKQWHSWCTHGMHVASWSHSCKTCGQLVYMLRKLACFWSRPAALKMDGVEKKRAVIVQELQDACLQCLVNTCVDVFLEGSCMHACYIMSFSASVEAWWTHPSPKAGLIYIIGVPQHVRNLSTCSTHVCMEFAGANLQARKEKENPSPAEEGKNMQLRLRHHDPMIQQKNLSIVSCLIRACACMHVVHVFPNTHACILSRYWLGYPQTRWSRRRIWPCHYGCPPGRVWHGGPNLSLEVNTLKFIHNYIDGWGWLC